MVIPFLKPRKGRSNPAHYRLIPLASYFRKIFERMVGDRLNWFLEENNLISKYQIWFWRNHSTYHHIFRLEADIRKGDHHSLFQDIIIIPPKRPKTAQNRHIPWYNKKTNQFLFIKDWYLLLVTPYASEIRLLFRKWSSSLKFGPSQTPSLDLIDWMIDWWWLPGLSDLADQWICHRWPSDFPSFFQKSLSIQSQNDDGTVGDSPCRMFHKSPSLYATVLRLWQQGWVFTI